MAVQYLPNAWRQNTIPVSVPRSELIILPNRYRLGLRVTNRGWGGGGVVVARRPIDTRAQCQIVL